MHPCHDERSSRPRTTADRARLLIYLDAQRTDIPWKNEGGATREIARSHKGRGVDDFDWRVSTAKIERDGTFSSFPGVERHIVNMGSSDVILNIDGIDFVLAPYEPLTFSGDSMTHARLTNGAIRDVNVMCRRSRASAVTMIRDVDGVHEEEANAGTWTLLVVLAGKFLAWPDVGDGRVLGSLDAVGGPGPLRFQVRGAGTLMIIRITEVRAGIE